MIKSKRQLPSPKYFLSLIDWRLPTFKRSKLATERALTVKDLAKIARGRVPKVVYDFVEGSALDEIG
jgi:L-lactate dehydrogenase (cytochrome)